jgi:N-acetylmuramoyl-L-alanine amidase
MAKSLTSIIALVGLLAVAGCQPTASTSMVQSLPPPNFSGPSREEHSAQQRPLAQAPAPVVVVPRATTPPPQHSGSAKAPADWVPAVPVNSWYYIVIHHSATPSGGAAAFDKEHRSKGWDELGYHFVIGNGTDTRDGQIEVGPRWRKQKWGAHAKTPDNRFNDHGIGICLVGNFDVSRPTAKQLESLAKLVAYLQTTYRIPSERIVGHGSVHNLANGGTITDCPGRNMNVAMVRKMSARLLADAGEPIPADHALAMHSSGELLHDTRK